METTKGDADSDRVLTFAQVLESEQARAKCRPPGQSVGLAFSGGGIRSATFNLGVIQALAERGWLGKFDYLSTISGGGYIGAWLTTFIHRLANGEVELAERQINDREDGLEHPAIRFLRAHSNYLTPRVGMSGDTLAVAAVYLRNLMLNLSVLITLLSAFLILPRVAVRLEDDEAIWAWLDGRYELTMFCVLVLATSVISLNLFCGFEGRNRPWFARAVPRLLFMDLPVIAAIWLATCYFYWFIGARPGEVLTLAWVGSTVGLYVLLWTVGSLVGYTASRLMKWTVRPRTPLWIGKFLFFAVITGVAGALLLAGVAKIMHSVPGDHRLWFTAAFVPPLMLLSYLTMFVLHIGLMGRLFWEQDRELWARLGGRYMAIAAGWMLIFGIALYSPAIVVWSKEWVVGLGGLGWLASTLFGVLAGNSAKTGDGKSPSWVERLTSIAPYVFVLGLLIGLSWGVHRVLVASDEARHGVALGKTEPVATPGGIYLRVDPAPQAAAVTARAIEPQSEWSHFERIVAAENDRLYAWFKPDYMLPVIVLVAMACVLLLSRRININLFSLHHFYRNRLARCYLGATNPRRRANPITGFDEDDDLELKDLCRKPLPILCASINLNRGGALAWQNRRAASFSFTPLHTGYEPASKQILGGYRPTERYAVGDDGKSLQLGAAVAISGAAASPNMGYHTSPAVAFLLTMFNMRLARWCGDPRHASAWRKADPGDSLSYLWAELTGSAGQYYPFVSLSDGGHFENLGIYELVRRRCGVIVASDACADQNYFFPDLAEAIRKCYADFGVRINIDVDKIRPQPGKNTSGSHFAIGEILYPEPDPRTGVLIYVKASVTEEMATDIVHYQHMYPDFPHQTTIDQFFDETQFESYRKLGYEVARRSIESMTADNHLPAQLR